MKNKGFTATEILIVISVLAILFAVLMGAFYSIRKQSNLKENTEEIVNNLRKAQSRTLASEDASQYGIYFDKTTDPHQIVIFNGVDYASRDVSYDKIRKLSNLVEIYNNNVDEVVFDRLTGMFSAMGGDVAEISLRLKSDNSETRTIYVSGAGLVGLTFPSSSTAGRIEDSRHIHFDYSRIIDDLTESITLTFEGGIIETFPITSNMVAGEIFWEGIIDVNGDDELIRVHTHNFNNLDTEFCIHRDRINNNKSLIITISGDATGSLIDYSADGSVTNSTSINVQNLIWQ